MQRRKDGAAGCTWGLGMLRDRRALTALLWGLVPAGMDSLGAVAGS